MPRASRNLPRLAALGALAFVALLIGCVQEPEGTHYVPDPPTVIHTAPADLETNVALDRVVTATFSEAMDPATINGSTFILLRAHAFGFDTVPGAVTYSAGDSTATFTPDDSLLPGQTYVARFLDGILDAECDTLADTSWSFTTATDGSEVCPDITVTRTTPADGAVNVDRGTAITATFSAPIDPATLNAATFIITGPLPVTGTFSYSHGDSTVTFIPDSDLPPGATYTISLTSGIQDSANGCPLTPYSWSFTTTTAPTPSTPVLDTTDFGDPTRLLVTWFQSTGATTYRLQVSTSPLFTTLVHDQPGIPDPSFFIVGGYVPATDIPAGTYYWRVNATGPGGTSNWSNVKSFPGYP